MAKKRSKKSKGLGQARRGCRCPAGAVRRSTKGRGMGFVCMRRISNAPRFVRKVGGRCPSGARRLKNGSCLGRGPGMRFVAPVCR